MLLCDVGNTTYNFFDGVESKKYYIESFNPSTVDEEVFYINVNSKLKSILEELPNYIDLEPYARDDRFYETMGIDRIVAIQAVDSGIVVDAGSAVTIDIIKDGNFLGGFIYPGRYAMQECYKKISPRLDYSFNFELNLDKIPKNSKDAISYGYIATLYHEVMKHNMDIYLTGGDAKEFLKVFRSAQLCENLIFDGMKKIIAKAGLC